MVYKLFGKRALDLILVSFSAFVWIPVILLCFVPIYFTMGWPVLFFQKRPGLHGKIFTLVKLRTMNDCKGNDADRVTLLGVFLRRTSLDELPSLFNVLKGDMSLVGPRPLLAQYLEHYTPEQMERHEVLPGLTGLAQIDGRQNTAFSRRIELDIKYTRMVSLGLDFKILIKTVWMVIFAKGVITGQDVKKVDDLGLYRA